MISVKDKYITIFITTIFVFVLWLYKNPQYIFIYQHVLCLYCIFGICFFLGYNELFVMTTKKLERYASANHVHYKYTLKSDKITVNKVYASVGDSDEWYELDYSLTIPKNSDLLIVKNFAKFYDTVGILLNTMEYRKQDPQYAERIAMYKMDNETTRSLTLLSCAIFTIIYLLCIIFS